MTLNADEFARAVIMAPQIEKTPIDVIAGHIFRDFAGQENATGVQIEKALEIWLTAFNMSRAAIVRSEFHRAISIEATTLPTLIGSILNRINLIDETTVMPSMLPGGMADKRSWSTRRIEELETAERENNEPLPLKRLTDLERRVGALEAAKVHPADRMAANTPTLAITPYVTTELVDYGSWEVVIKKWDTGRGQYMNAAEFIGKFNDAPTAKSHAIQYAADQGFEYRD